MKTTRTLLMACLMLLLFGCKLDEPLDKQVFDMDALPEITYEGSNVLACRVNGEIFLSKTTMAIPITHEPSFTVYNDHLLVIMAKDFARMYESSIMLTANYVSGLTDLELVHFHEPWQTDFQDSRNFTHGRYKKIDSEPSSLKILYIDDKIAVGTFAFTAVSERGDTVRITDGRFDIARD